MRVLMLGWEFPPFISGGLGTACYGLTKAMSRQGIDVIFVLPRPVTSQFSTHVKLATPVEWTTIDTPAGRQYRLREFEHVSFRTVDAPAISPYIGQAEYEQRVEQLKAQGKAVDVSATNPHRTSVATPAAAGGAKGHYEGDMLSEAHRYARLAVDIARNEQFDVIHAHDWMTYPAGLAVAAFSRKPLVVHIHSTEFDRSGERVWQQVYDIERAGLHGAQKIIAVSHLTRNIVINRYGVPPEKIEVVYNAVDNNGQVTIPKPIARTDKIVLFFGRITMQKGPEYFLAAAKKVLDVYPDVKFVMAGSGDMTKKVIELAAEMGIGHRVLFTGFLRGADVDRIFKMADLYVMPSVSEPFGIAPLEAISHDVPVIISKQSGVSEILTHVLKVDFWDINEMANKILAVLRHPPLGETLRRQSGFEVQQLSWDKSAKKVNEVYESVVGAAQ
ncbi:MAG: glycosyltransferase family 4 protein [Phycisphaerae bacterium]|nr:glycosyltransferase family 4 protein [Phycisphaerae bacterium]